MRHRLFGKLNKNSITAAFPVVVMLILFSVLSCSGEKNEIVKVVFQPDSSYTMRTTDVVTLISDSGVTRYKVKAKEWLVFDKAQEPYWFFPSGVYFEKFDSLYETEAFLRADTAYNYTKKEHWKFSGNVKIENLQGDKFDTSVLYIDQRGDSVYSDRYIKIQRGEEVITGIGFWSNLNMTKYRILSSTAEFQLNETPQDTTSVETINVDEK
jgi:LPS export ABC transporter protein LptC